VSYERALVQNAKLGPSIRRYLGTRQPRLGQVLPEWLYIPSLSATFAASPAARAAGALGAETLRPGIHYVHHPVHPPYHESSGTTRSPSAIMSLSLPPEIATRDILEKLWTNKRRTRRPTKNEVKGLPNRTALASNAGVMVGGAEDVGSILLEQAGCACATESSGKWSGATGCIGARVVVEGAED